MAPVSSSAVSEVGHDPEAKVMRIRYSSGALYEFPDIEAEQYRALLNADSIGRHINTYHRGKGTRLE